MILVMPIVYIWLIFVLLKLSMKKIISLALLIVILVFNQSVQAQKKAPWKEMEDFHTVMGATFHPAEEGKLEPLKTRSSELAAKAIAWKNSTAPEGYNQSAVKKKLKKLAKDAKEINKMVQKNASDRDLKEEITELHDVFHEIMEKCEH